MPESSSQAERTDFEKLLDARLEHFDVAAKHEMWIIRTLDGLAIGLRCKPCDWEWWRPGWERNDSEVGRG